MELKEKEVKKKPICSGFKSVLIQSTVVVYTGAYPIHYPQRKRQVQVLKRFFSVQVTEQKPCLTKIFFNWVRLEDVQTIKT